MHMIRKTFRFGIRMGLLVGVGLALFRLIQGRRSSDVGRPSGDWAPAPSPAPNPNLPKVPPEPELVTPAMLEEVIRKKAAQPVAPPAVTPAPPPEPAARVEPAKKKAPAKKAPVKKAAPPPAEGAVKKVTPKKAPAAKKAPTAKKAAPAKKAAKKQTPPTAG
jgi:hypothetical protein